VAALGWYLQECVLSGSSQIILCMSDALRFTAREIKTAKLRGSFGMVFAEE